MQNFRLSKEYLQEVDRRYPKEPHMVLADLFAPFPDQFGLRGDPYLWGIMAAHLNYSWVEEDDFGKPVSVDTAIKSAFRKLTGQCWEHAPDEFQVEGLNHGGSSGGWISMDWWRSTGLPLLKSRFDAVDEHLSDEGLIVPVERL